MIKELHCVYCGNPNPRHARFCATCKARFPEWPEQFSQSDDEEEMPGKSPDEPALDVSQQKEPFPVPRQGEIVGGLFRFTEEVIEGIVPPDRFSDRLGHMEDAVNSAFSTIFSDLQQIPSDVEDYSSSIRELLRYVQFMLSLSFQEMSLFCTDRDPDHLRFGRMLAQRAELEYIRIMEMLRSDSRSDPFSGQPFVVGKLASEVIEGTLDLKEFHARIEKLEIILQKQIEKAGEMIRKGLTEARKYNGTDDDIIMNSIHDLAIAGDLLGRAVLNLTDPSAVRNTMKEFVEEALKKVQGESALQDSEPPLFPATS